MSKYEIWMIKFLHWRVQTTSNKPMSIFYRLYNEDMIFAAWEAQIQNINAKIGFDYSTGHQSCEALMIFVGLHP